MNFENQLTAANIRKRHDDLPIEAARAQQCRVQNVRTIGRRYYNNAFVALEAVHLNEHNWFSVCSRSS